MKTYRIRMKATSGSDFCFFLKKVIDFQNNIRR